MSQSSLNIHLEMVWWVGGGWVVKTNFSAKLRSHIWVGVGVRVWPDLTLTLSETLSGTLSLTIIISVSCIVLHLKIFRWMGWFKSLQQYTGVQSGDWGVAGGWSHEGGEVWPFCDGCVIWRLCWMVHLKVSKYLHSDVGVISPLCSDISKKIVKLKA